MKGERGLGEWIGALAFLDFGLRGREGGVVGEGWWGFLPPKWLWETI
jgi:hypothetical protein